MSKSFVMSQASHMYPFSAPLTWRDSETQFAGMAQYPLISEIDYKPSDQNHMLTALGGCGFGGGELSSIFQTARRYESGVKDGDRQYTNSMKAPMPTMYNSRNDENGFGVFDRSSQSVNLSSNAQQQEAINHPQLFHDHSHVPSQMIAEENVKPMVSSLPCSPARVPGGQMNQIADQVHNQPELRCGAFVKAGADEGPYVVQVGSSSSSPLDMLLSADGSAAQNAILTHPLYPYLVATHIDCCKLGAEPADLKILGEALSNYQHLQPPNNSIPSDGTRLDLDNVMAWYLRMLVDLKKSIEEPFFREMEWCNEIFAKVKLLGPSSSPTEMTEGQSRAGHKEGFASTVGETSQSSHAPPFDHKKALATELMKEDKMIKDWLKTKHDRSEIYSLRGQCSKKRRQGKHPETARECLLEWFNVHGDWPYPSEEEKLRLARLTKLEARQINNWFINQRKRHWESPIKDETFQDVQEELKSQRQFANIDKVLLDRFRVPSDALNNSSYSWSPTFT